MRIKENSPSRRRNFNTASSVLSDFATARKIERERGACKMLSGWEDYALAVAVVCGVVLALYKCLTLVR